MLQIIESQRKEIRYLNQKCSTLNEEREYLIDNFQMSTQVLLERIKDLEAQADPIQFGHDRPQTANVLSKICKCFNQSYKFSEAEKEGRRIGGGGY